MKNATPKKVAVKKAKPAPKPAGRFKVTMKYNGEEVSAQTDSIQEVLLEQEQKYLKTNGVFTVEYNGRSFTVVLGRAQSLRCFRNKIAALSLENRFKLALNVTD